MSLEDFNMAFNCSKIIEARKTLVELTTADFPNMKKNSREKIHKSIHKTAFPQIHSNQKPSSTEEFAKLIAGASNG